MLLTAKVHSEVSFLYSQILKNSVYVKYILKNNAAMSWSPDVNGINRECNWSKIFEWFEKKCFSMKHIFLSFPKKFAVVPHKTFPHKTFPEGYCKNNISKVTIYLFFVYDWKPILLYI